MNKKILFILVLVVVVSVVSVASVLYLLNKKSNSMTFDDCSSKYGATKSYPGTCVTPDGVTITEEIN